MGEPLSLALDRAAQQHGVVSFAQLCEVGLTPGQVRGLIGRGVLGAVAPRVYAVGGSPPSLERRQMAGLLSLGRGAMLSHEAAARLHGFDRSLPDVVEFTVPRERRGVRSPFVVHTTSRLVRLDRVTVGGWPCTSATRTVLDLARLHISEARLEAAIDSAIRSGASAPLVLVKRLEGLRGRGAWGAPMLDRLLLDAGGHTILERRFLALVRRARLPRPSTQVVHRRDGRTLARVDFLFEPYGIVVEVSGGRGHSSPAERAKDAQRRNELQDIGRRVYEYTYEHVTRRPMWVMETMTARLVAAGWLPPRPRIGS